MRLQKIYGWWDIRLGKPRKTISKYTLVRLKRHYGKKGTGHWVREKDGGRVFQVPGSYIQVQKKNKRGKWVTFKKKFTSEIAAVDFLCAVVKKMQIRQHINGSLD